MYEEEKILKKQRQQAGLTQIELAEKISVTQGQVSGIERGDRMLHLWTAAKITPELKGIHPHELFVNQNLFNAVNFLDDRKERLEELKVDVANFPGFQKIKSPEGQRVIEINSDLMDIAKDTRVRIKSMYTAFSNFWLSTGKTTGEERLTKIRNRGQDLIDETLNQVDNLVFNPKTIHKFRSAMKPLDVEQVKNRIKNNEENSNNAD